MGIGYLGYAKITDKFLLCNSTGLNRQVNPLESRAVWGAGWYNAASVTNYADSQQHFEGAINFELQGDAELWDLIRDWLVEQRAFAKSCIISPNGIISYEYTKDDADPRSGVWMRQCSINIDNNALITMAATCIGLKRTEIITGSSYITMRTGVGAPTAPMNPAPRNRNPIPGWNAAATVVWPNAPAFYSQANPAGMVLMSANVNVDNNTQIIRGCTGDVNPVAVIQGTISAEGAMNLWRDGGIPDPYGTPGNFTAANASVTWSLGGAPALVFRLPHLLLRTDAYDVTGQNNPTTRNFGLAGVGDGVAPPFLMDAATVTPP
jgi:hypothetical protein